IGWTANGSVSPVVVVVAELCGAIWSKLIPDCFASAFSVRITSAVASLLGIAWVRLKTLAERTAGSACWNALERLAAIWACTAAVCFFRLDAVERFGEIRAR